ncbi:MAG: flagellar hook-basal body complex protein FliE [Thermodesulfobacteriota bacterium]|nr:flagellar hook-basal body complex protein FliE [Thermodesulfobacteriota bacterium]
MRIGSIAQGMERLEGPGGTLGRSDKAAVSFTSELKERVSEVDDLQHQAEKTMREGAIRGAENIHEAMIKLQEAEIGLQFLVKVRDKALEAYQDVMRMQF